MKRNRIMVLMGAFAVLSGAVGCARRETGIIWEGSISRVQEETGSELDAEQQVVLQSETAREMLVVDICGAVTHPGVYELDAGARVCDAVEMAGGFRDDADIDSLNQAALLSDGDKIKVYTVAEAAQGAAGSAQAAGTTGAPRKININRADIEQLCTLSGIGEARARDIIAYRETNGDFKSVEEIMNVNGIKNAVFERIKDDISVR